MLSCRLKVINPYNHGSSKCKRQIKTISKIIIKHLWDKGQMWPLFATMAAYAMNTFVSETLSSFSPFPGYNLPTLEFMLPLVNDDEDLILEDENPEIYVHLENILVHMIDTQDIAIFKSQKDYIRNKQKLSEYICYAQMWQVLLVIFSYVAFTCDIILVITLIIFLIRYQKAMQAMLTAFINMNTSNSGIPSAKADPISRTFPPLFMIKISEEEKIVEDLQEIESMQLIVQVIMVIVCTIVAFIVLYYYCKKFRHTCTLFKYCFPFLPILRILRTSCRTDLFVEVTNVTKGNTVWAHFMATGYFPINIHLSRPIPKESVRIETRCCIFK